MISVFALLQTALSTGPTTSAQPLHLAKILLDAPSGSPDTAYCRKSSPPRATNPQLPVTLLPPGNEKGSASGKNAGVDRSNH